MRDASEEDKDGSFAGYVSEMYLVVVDLLEDGHRGLQGELDLGLLSYVERRKRSLRVRLALVTTSIALKGRTPAYVITY